MKKEVTNEFKDGLNFDLNPIVTPNTVLTDNLNGTFITYNGNEFCLQNDRGNVSKASLTPGYIPIGIKEHNGILYIVSNNRTKTEIGVYPGLGAYNKFDYGSYTPLKNTKTSESLTINDYSTSTPITIEIQNSYDGSVNLILVADGKKPRIINSGFSKENDNEYKFITRTQSKETNIYDLTTVATDSELIRSTSAIVNFELEGVQSGGQLKGGNYTFYLKFGDADYNQTDVVAESGIVSIFKGNDGIPSTISGTLLDERTDKMVQLKITGIDTRYSKLYIYYIREYSDTQGFRMTESGMLIDPIDINAKLENGIYTQNIWINGFEQTQSINIEELNVEYHTIDSARAEEQHSNMLFLGNVEQSETYELYNNILQNHAHSITTTLKQDLSVGFIDPNDFTGSGEYYDTQNIYSKLGYWPDEYYRFGIVYILKDGSTTPVFNMRGGVFTDINSPHDNSNAFGVFKTPNIQILFNNNVKPLYFNFTIPTLPDKVAGYFIVRQKRIPLTICQGIKIGIDKVSHTPLINNNSSWITESFISHPRKNFSGIKKGIDYNPKLVYNDVTITTNSSGITVQAERDKTDSEKIYYIAKEIEKVPYTVADYNSINDITDAVNTKLSYWRGNGRLGMPIGILNSTDYDYITDDYVATFTKYRLHFKRTGDSTWEELVEPGNVYFYIAVFEDNAGHAWDHLYFDKLVLTYNDSETYDTAIHDANEKNNEKVSISGDVDSDKFISIPTSGINTWGLVSLDPCVNSNVSSQLDGSEFILRKEYDTSINNNGLIISNTPGDFTNTTIENSLRCTFISPNTNVKTIDEYSYSNIAGNATDVKGKQTAFAYYLTPFGNPPEPIKDKGNVYYYESGVTEDYLETRINHTNFDLNRNLNLIRGRFLPYIGVAAKFENNTGLYSIRNKDISEASYIRENDNSPFYCVSERSKNSSINVFGGDCFTCTVGIRVLSNFIDPTAPVVDEILDPWTWNYNVTVRALDASKEGNKVAYSDVNLTDVNTVSLGYWVTFKCLSSYNLGLRSVDSFHTDEIALLGSPRSFYPLNGASTATGNKMEESFLLNDGYSATVGEKRYNLLPDQPYSKSEFANRIMFSNVHITDAFTNGYRTFQGLSYKDYDKQYGAITKLIGYGQNLFVVMEHGLALVPVNPKALMQTTTGEAIHIYGHGVLPDEMTIISQDYGSKYEHSVIRTPIGIYGIDVDAKKIWLFSDKQGFQTISDMKIETLLKDELETTNIEIPNLDIRTHYNAFKGDVMFTWKTEKYQISICYNERLNNSPWVTRYSWIPIVSENINDKFYSLQYRTVKDSTGEEILDKSKVWIWDHTPSTQTEPTKWYGKQHPFEFEFVVSDPIGVNKIFDNIQIISNNTQPDEMEIAIIGDSYTFNRKEVDIEEDRSENAAFNDVYKVYTTSNIHSTRNDNDFSNNLRYKFDWRLKESALTKLQKFKDIYKFGRRMGNIQYRDGIWYSNIEPLNISDTKQVRIRDKWARIRIRYTGEDMAVITAIKTLINI